MEYDTRKLFEVVIDAVNHGYILGHDVGFHSHYYLKISERRLKKLGLEKGDAVVVEHSDGGNDHFIRVIRPTRWRPLSRIRVENQSLEIYKLKGKALKEFVDRANSILGNT